ncbi:50S ribosomal protein L20 [Morus notabilis]|uniref:Large ribosomal subunit protein bL20c n=1 Tax=Morus notabilis TaxID=981085 RepID=W9QYU3_9ROSA|nr:50S ribosomal protein L20 [Morus notabilis]
MEDRRERYSNVEIRREDDAAERKLGRNPLVPEVTTALPLDGKEDSTMNKGKIFKLAKGFRGRAKNCIRIARERVEKALQYSYRDRRTKKRDMRSLWIERINAGTRQHGVNYGNFMHGLTKENIQLNRKVLSELSMHEPYSFKALVNISRSSFPGNKNIVFPPKKEVTSLRALHLNNSRFGALYVGTTLHLASSCLSFAMSSLLY